MCIVLFTTSHPGYSLVLLDNRDEYILRPTSLPEWWTHPTSASGEQVLSSRDLQREAKGTWLGITKTGTLAVLTNYREAQQPAAGTKSRGGMVNAWLGGLPDRGVREGVRALVEDGGVQGVGGFSMVCSKLRRKGEGIAIVSNRAEDVRDVPIIDLAEEGVWGLSNTVYNNPDEWPKVTKGKKLLQELISDAVATGMEEDRLVAALFDLLDQDTLPPRTEGVSFQQFLFQLKHTIFVPPIGGEDKRQMLEASSRRGEAVPRKYGGEAGPRVGEETTTTKQEKKKEEEIPFSEGLYGTQRQTVLLVDWDGNVTFVERALWDAEGAAIPRGQGDVVFKFTIEGWDD